MRALCLVTLLAFAGGCASDGARRGSAARNVLLGVGLVAAGVSVGSAVVAERKEKSLREDVEARAVTGRQFVERDAEGQRWNRAVRGSAFVGGLALVGLAVLWEMGHSSEAGRGEPATPAPASAASIVFPPPGQAAAAIATGVR